MTSRPTVTRFGLAFAASLALHALVMSSTRFDLPGPPQPASPLEARIVPAAKPAPVPAPPAKPRPRRAAAEPRVLFLPETAAPSPLVLPLEPEPEPEMASVADEAPIAQEAPPLPEQIALAPESTAAEPVNSLPPRGRIEYVLSYGRDGFPIGTAVQSWEMEDGNYVLASDAETTGFVEMFRPQRLRYLSKGKVTPQGLKPSSFVLSRTRRGRTEASRARFDWENGQLVYGHAQDRKTAALAAGTQDVMSFAYHFALVPPQPGRFQLAVTTGARLDTHDVDVLPEETIETPIGSLRVLPLKQLARPGAERIEVWLAADYRYLPVKIRFFDRDGEYAGEQVVTEIRLSQD